MQLTVTPSVATSSASVLVSPAMSCLAITYAVLLGLATRLCAEAVAMIRPHFFAFMNGTAARYRNQAELLLIRMIASNFSGGKSSILASCWMPALAITIRSEEHTSEHQSLMRISYAHF